MLPFITLRLAPVATCYFNQTSCLAAIKPDHAAFYRRIFNAFQIGGPAPYPGLIVPRYLYEAPCGDNLAKTLARFPFFRSSPIETAHAFRFAVRRSGSVDGAADCKIHAQGGLTAASPPIVSPACFALWLPA